LLWRISVCCYGRVLRRDTCKLAATTRYRRSANVSKLRIWLVNVDFLTVLGLLKETTFFIQHFNTFPWRAGGCSMHNFFHSIFFEWASDGFSLPQRLLRGTLLDEPDVNKIEDFVRHLLWSSRMRGRWQLGWHLKIMLNSWKATRSDVKFRADLISYWALSVHVDGSSIELQGHPDDNVRSDFRSRSKGLPAHRESSVLGFADNLCSRERRPRNEWQSIDVVPSFC
jgi:hypothetical protein